MKILVVGLGLIGGSICKALKKYTSHTVIGLDNNKKIESQAISDKCIDYIFDDDYKNIELVIICLYPELTEKWLIENADRMNQGTLVTDVCGVKGNLSLKLKNISIKNKIEYIGIHPMAGKEFGGYINSTPDLYINANFIITPFDDSSEENINLLKNLVLEIGAGKIVVTSPENHDKMIAYTSQLAHVVSSAYVKSPELDLECGFSGGSFQDMTRIATMNEKMWTDLFMQNRKNLSFELDTLIKNLSEYKTALEDEDYIAMQELIKKGRELKEENLRKRIGQPN